MLSHLVRSLTDDIMCAANSSVPSWLYVIAFRFVVHPVSYYHPWTVLTHQKYCSLVAQPRITLSGPLRQNLVFTVEGTSMPSTARNPISIEGFPSWLCKAIPEKLVHLYNEFYRCISSQHLCFHLWFQVCEKYTDMCHTIQKLLGTNLLFTMGMMLTFYLRPGMIWHLPARVVEVQFWT